MTSSVWAQNSKKNDWLSTPIKFSPEAYFTNLTDEQQLSSPFVVKFGMSHWGIAPAEHKHDHTGHHHILVDTPLPIPLDKSMDFSEKYKHFGKGQIETVLKLPNGKHTLRLLVADHKHVPTFLFSREYNIEIIGQTPGDLPLGYTKAPKVEILNLTDGQTVASRFKVLMHASNLNIALSSPKLANTGHFGLTVRSAQGVTQNINFTDGATEAWLTPPKGKVSLQLKYIDNLTGSASEHQSEKITVRVQ